MSRSSALWLVATLLLAETGCSQDMKWTTVLKGVRSDFPEVQQISTDSLARRLASDQPILLFDTRTKEEYAVSHLPGARRLDPDAPDFSVLDGVPADMPIALYCSVGYRSSALARQLGEQGFVQVSNVEGSIFKWANEGRRVVRADTSVTRVHGYNRLWGRLLDPVYRTYSEDGGS